MWPCFEGVNITVIYIYVIYFNKKKHILFDDVLATTMYELQ